MPPGLEQQIGDLLVQKNWLFGQDQSTGVYCFRIQYQSTLIPFELSVAGDAQMVIGSAFFLPCVPLRSRKVMLEFVSAVNFQLSTGGLELEKTNYLRYRQAMLLRGLTISADTLDLFVIRVAQESLKLKNAVLAVLHGDLAADALNLIES
jgi:hypothetical protein